MSCMVCDAIGAAVKILSKGETPQGLIELTEEYMIVDTGDALHLSPMSHNVNCSATKSRLLSILEDKGKEKYPHNSLSMKHIDKHWTAFWA